ncbi:MAG: hydroxymethylglutaryl-CoA lyase [Planctomycetes bacterium]|nr:hydroxymethylglutaryl-CoA lyase [Planctomycetota bacterium]
MAVLTRDRLPRAVTVYEVGPRDGLQNEAVAVPLAAKRAFVEALAAAGLRRVEATSFVHPKWVPQLADAAELMTALTRRPGTSYPVLVPNEKGLDRALACGCDAVAVFAAVTEGFSRRNQNASVAEVMAGLRPVVERARAAGLWVRGYLSVVWGCPYEGHVDPARARTLAGDLVAMGVDEVSLGDTIGVATPGEVERVVDLVAAAAPRERLALHFHDTRGTALANVLAGLLAGVTTFDASAGGLGGCPYAVGASGNLDTCDLLYMLHGLGIETGVDLDAVRAAAQGVAAALGRPLPGRYSQAGPLVPQGSSQDR